MGIAVARIWTGAALRVWLPVILIFVAAAVRPARPAVLFLLVGGVGVALASSRFRRTAPSPLLLAWAAAIPIAVNLAWGLLPPPDVSGGGSCTDPFSPYAAWRLAEAGLVLGAIAILTWRLGLGLRSLAMRRPDRVGAVLAAGGFVLAGPLALVFGSTLGRPFFGEYTLAIGTLGAIPPALLFAVSNGTMEEVAYRGALLNWSTPGLGATGALVAQAAAFALAHTGPDFVGSPLPVVTAMFAGGLIAGLIVRRTGSLAIPIALHVALDIPLYYYWACPIT